MKLALLSALVGLVSAQLAACKQNEYRSPISLLCKPQKKLGEYCNSIQKCADGVKCVANVCSQPPTGSCLRPGCESKIAKKVTTNKWSGGTLYVTKAANPTAWTAIVDLADAAIAAGCVPKHKPHMVVPSPTGKHTAIAYTGDTFVHILDSASKKIIMCIDATAPAAGVVGGTIHTVAWFGADQILLNDMSGTVNNIAGGAIHKFTDLNFTNGSYKYNASLALGTTTTARGTTSSRPIALQTNPLGAFKHLYFVTDAVGGASFLDANLMRVTTNIPVADMAPCSAGGLWVEPHPEDPAIVITQYGTQNDPGKVTPECLYQVNLQQQKITKTYNLPASADDAHGIQFCKNNAGKFFLINTNRASFTLDILNYDTGALVVQGWDLNTQLPNYTVKLLQPDVVFYTGGSLFMAARGPEPVSAVKPQNYLPTAKPGVFWLKIVDCVTPQYQNTYNLATELNRSIITSDVHSIWGVNDEIWVVDQAATGSVEAYEVYSKCAV